MCMVKIISAVGPQYSLFCLQTKDINHELQSQSLKAGKAQHVADNTDNLTLNTHGLTCVRGLFPTAEPVPVIA